ncbi:hypothetical protein ATO12_17645 [Aquimarina atlantica]|uniref:Uncharacterized protein n=2 Tax=Aquimarina atlantica TaxID=1317122 RepID=A0A023BVD7_9FLAO|nr:hypothetical protein ATO12_17645 [Aquimarina atlantica]
MIHKKMIFRIVLLCCFLIVLSNCGSYHTKSTLFQAKIQQGDMQGAMEVIEENKFLGKPRNHLLYLLEKGKLAYLAGDYTLSNELLNEADLFIESNKRAIGNQVLGILLNPEKETYKGEDFEKVAIHYYKALNYIFLNQYDEAIVEAKRISLQLQKINESYPPEKKNRYNDDAFAHILQGLLYEASGDLNNAFIAYRNAVDLYLENQGTYIGVNIPEQLCQDMFHTASAMGFTDEIERYEKLLNTTYIPKKTTEGGEAIIFWENGLAPYKDETFYTFTILPGNEIGFLTIINEDLSLNLPLPIPTGGDNNSDFSDLDIFNVAYPKYVSQQSLYNNAEVQLDSVSYSFQLTQDYEEIAFKTLKDRTFREIGKIALRLGTKKVSEYIVKNQNNDLGALLGVFNALTEGADTRNWQSLPNKIFYTRIPLKKGENSLTVKLHTNQGEFTSKNIKIQGNGGIQFEKITTPRISHPSQ